MPEIEPLLPSNCEDLQTEEERLPNHKSKWVILPIFFAALYIGNKAMDSNKSQMPDEAIDKDSLAASGMSIKAHSGYGEPSSISQGFYSDISAVVEPHRVATFFVSSESISNMRTATFNWIIVEETETTSKKDDDEFFDSEAFSQQEDTTKYVPTSYSLEPNFDMEKAYKLESTSSIAYSKFGAISGKRMLVIAECLDTGETASVVVHGKYVRRELRSLTKKDRELYLEAMHKVYTTDTKTGRELYGDKYLGHDHFAYHHLGPAQLNHPWHNTPVFFTAHAMFSAQFEKSMQLVEPSVAMHYWDYVMDSEKYSDTRKFKNGWAESDIWSSDYFGPMTFSDDGLLLFTSLLKPYEFS
jgi:hypothetical protein